MKLVTNNPRFKNEDYPGLEVEFLDITYGDILKKVRDYVHENWEILSHPLYGSVKPNETIYRSIVIEKKDRLDSYSEALISDAITTFEKFRANKKTPNWIPRVKDDFSVIDYDLISQTINRIIK